MRFGLFAALWQVHVDVQQLIRCLIQNPGRDVGRRCSDHTHSINYVRQTNEGRKAGRREYQVITESIRLNEVVRACNMGSGVRSTAQISCRCRWEPGVLRAWRSSSWNVSQEECATR